MLSSMRLRWPFLALAAAAAVGATLILTREDGLPSPDELAVIDPDAKDPFAYDEGRRADFERRAALGSSHVLYAKSPGGVVAAARRTERYRAQVEAAAPAGGVEADMLEAIVFLESAGREDAVADSKLEGAVGLTQILAETGRNLLGMRVDPARARRLSRRIGRAERRGDTPAADRLRARRRKVDERFDPVRSLEATGRYLRFARERLGREDFAITAYHMGVGNLQRAIADFTDYGSAPRSYAELYFGSSLSSKVAAYRRLAALGDDSSTYLWRVLAAREIMRAFRDDRSTLERTADLQTAKNSAEEVLHPEEETQSFGDPEALEEAYRDGHIRAFPNSPRLLGLRRDPRMGELSRRLKQAPRLYRGLRPEAYALAAYMAKMVRSTGGSDAPLAVTSTVRDRQYQRLLLGRNREATSGYSLHTTGYAFDVLRSYRSRKQALAFQFALDRLQALNLIAWVREPSAIHITVSADASRLEPLLRSAPG
ncbi:MAG: transglycosylase SLT domain-containing protein [Actinomycetota bacterium]|nr:transglycosylase SLT domain-containing protein [Actinomycetota bacterium]